MSLRRAAFLDRDGVLNVDHGYVVRPADFQWMPGVQAALKRLQRADYALVVVTNQSGVARGYFTEAEVEALHQHMQRALATDGIALAGIYACPHHPQGTVAAYQRQCDCRKPGPGLITRAAAELGLDVGQSLLVGDKASDIAAARAAGVARAWLVGSADEAHRCGASGAVRDLAEAAERELSTWA